MSYKLFLDDERMPPEDGENWVIVRNFEEFRFALTCLGTPVFISFDHDLGDKQPSGYECALLLIKFNMKPEGFGVHSQNPVGAQKIWNVMRGWIILNEVPYIVSFLFK